MIQVFGSHMNDSWVSQSIRLNRNSSVIEIEYTVGPVPYRDGRSREVFTRFSSDIASGDKFFSDSNGYETYEQRRNFRHNFKLNETEPIAQNIAAEGDAAEGDDICTRPGKASVIHTSNNALTPNEALRRGRGT